MFLSSVFAEETRKPDAAENSVKTEQSVSTERFIFAPPRAGTNESGKPSPFSAEISSDFIKQVMETSAKIEAAKRRIDECKKKLYETNSEIKSLRSKMEEIQREINRILDEDGELTGLKMTRDLLWSTMPPMPKIPDRAIWPGVPAED